MRNVPELYSGNLRMSRKEPRRSFDLGGSGYAGFRCIQRQMQKNDDLLYLRCAYPAGGLIFPDRECRLER